MYHCLNEGWHVGPRSPQDCLHLEYTAGEFHWAPVLREKLSPALPLRGLQGTWGQWEKRRQGIIQSTQIGLRQGSLLEEERPNWIASASTNQFQKLLGGPKRGSLGQAWLNRFSVGEPPGPAGGSGGDCPRREDIMGINTVLSPKGQSWLAAGQPGRALV